MRWVIERNLFFANDQIHFVDALKTRGLKYLLVDFLPFEHTLSPEPSLRCVHCGDVREQHDDDSGCDNSTTYYEPEALVALGSTNFVRTVAARGWKPGVWHNQDFRFEVWKDRLGTQLLNHDGIVQPLGDLDFEGTRFIRPCEDLKSFSGTLVAREKVNEFRAEVLHYDVMAEANLLTLETPCVVAYQKEIEAEFRFFVVGRRVISGCQFRPHWDATTSARYGMACEFAEFVADQWGPADAYVVDIAKTPWAYYVVEYNCLNAAGLYACPVDPLILAIENLVQSRQVL